MFTRQHYIAIAEIIKNRRNVESKTEFDALAGDFAIYFAADNPRFNSMKFLVAAGCDDA
jgi:hypothetical protein